MNRASTITGFALMPLLLSGCGQPVIDVPIDAVSDVVLSSSSSADTEVVLEGTLREAGITTYMEGTHRLETSDGRIFLLESSLLDLGQYVGSRVRITGESRPTVEAGGVVVTVQQVEVLQGGVDEMYLSSSSLSSDAASSSEESSSVASSLAASSAVRSSAAASSVVRASSSAMAMSSSGMASSVSSITGTSDAHTAAMAKAKVDGSTFTQIFCTRHAGFCVPLHKSWFYNSFGATSSYLWHVEVSSEELTNLGDGPLVVNLVSGALPDASADGTVASSGNAVIGYRAWTNNRHFEITAPSALQTAVAYMTNNLTVYQPEVASSSAASSVSTSAASSSVSSH